MRRCGGGFCLFSQPIFLSLRAVVLRLFFAAELLQPAGDYREGEKIVRGFFGAVGGEDSRIRLAICALRTNAIFSRGIRSRKSA